MCASLVNMRPVLAVHDVANAGVTNPEPFSDPTLNHPLTTQTPDFNDILRADSRHVQLLAYSASTLARHIGHVVCLRPKEQMVWTDTPGIIAAMQYPEAGRNRSIAQFPGNTRGYTARILPWCDMDPDRPSADPVPPTGPQPTGAEIRAVLWNGAVAVNLGPEPLRQSTLRAHRASPVLGVTPRDVASIAGVHCVNYTTRRAS